MAGDFDQPRNRRLALEREQIRTGAVDYGQMYLDVDDTFNADQPHRDWGKTTTRNVLGYRVRWAEALILELKAMPLELVWATTWVEQAPEVLAPVIGWGASARYLGPVDGVLTWPTIDWKFDSIREDQALLASLRAELGLPAPRVSFVWLDNEIGPEHVAWAESVGGLAIAPNERTGLSSGDTSRVWEHIRVAASASGASDD